MCRREIVTYSMQCILCHKAWVSTVYWGETSRPLLLRGKKYWSAYYQKSPWSRNTNQNIIYTDGQEDEDDFKFGQEEEGWGGTM